MKFHNKFIAAGLAIGLSFTGTYMSYSWFTDSANQSHTITIEQLVKYCAYDTEAEIVNGGLSIDIPLNLRPVRWPTNDNKDARLTINNKYGEMEKLGELPNRYNPFYNHTGFPTQYYNKMKIPSDTNIDITEIDKHSKANGHVYPEENDYIDVVITSYVGQTLEPAKPENFRYYKYRIVFTRHDEGHSNKLRAHWIHMEQSIQVDSEDDISKEQQDTSTTDNTLQNENNGEATPPELDEGSKEETGEENQEPEEIPEQTPEEVPSEDQAVTLPLEENNQ